MGHIGTLQQSDIGDGDRAVLGVASDFIVESHFAQALKALGRLSAGIATSAVGSALFELLRAHL